MEELQGVGKRFKRRYDSFQTMRAFKLEVLFLVMQEKNELVPLTFV